MENVSLKYIETAKEISGLSYYAIAKKIGVTPQQINALKHRDNELKDESLLLLAQIAQTAPMKIIAEKHKRTAKGQAERKFWEAITHSKELIEETKRYILCSIQKDIKIY